MERVTGEVAATDTPRDILLAELYDGRIVGNPTDYLFELLSVHCYTMFKILCWYPHRESNPDLRLRRPLFYPLNYEDRQAPLDGSLRKFGYLVTSLQDGKGAFIILG